MNESRPVSFASKLFLNEPMSFASIYIELPFLLAAGVLFIILKSVIFLGLIAIEAPVLAKEDVAVDFIFSR